MDTLRKWLAAETTIEALEKKNNSGYMRCIKFIETGRKPIKVSLDFVEGEVTGRTIKDTVRIDEKFVLKSQKTRIKISKKEIEVRVPSYTDYFILKIVSGRTIDVKDLATLTWKKGISQEIRERISELMPYPETFQEKLGKFILPTIKDKKFLNSWKGTFMATEFDEETKNQIIKQLSKLYY
ncbi:MAG: hypothetical protein QXL24_03315 [Candidatus Jordarchaeaceae archaeon]